MTFKSGHSDVQRLEMIAETIWYCQRVKQLGMVQAAWTKALREAVFFMWECRYGPKHLAARYRSSASADLRWGKREIVYDHAVPFSVVQRELVTLKAVDVDSIREVLDKWLVACIITRDEDNLLTSAGLRNRMPSGWDGEDVLARYRKVGIEVSANSGVSSIAAKTQIFV